MNTCSCKADIEAKLVAEFVAAYPDVTHHKVSLLGYSYSVRKTDPRGYMPYIKYSVAPGAKDGSPADFSIGTTYTAYCPFCGQKAGPV